MIDNTSKTKILILSANPKKLQGLRLQEEEREIKEALRLIEGRDEFIIDHKGALRLKDLEIAMWDFKPNIVHFCGHGAGHKGLVLENEIGQAQLVKAKALANFFDLFKGFLKCVVLNACYSDVQAREIVEKIDYVIGMTQDIGDEAAIKYARSFYVALAGSKSFEVAHQAGCNGIELAGLQEEMKPQILKKKRYSI